MNPLLASLCHRVTSRKRTLILGLVVSVLVAGTALSQAFDWQASGSTVYYDSGSVVVGGTTPSFPGAPLSILGSPFAAAMFEQTSAGIMMVMGATEPPFAPEPDGSERSRPIPSG